VTNALTNETIITENATNIITRTHDLLGRPEALILNPVDPVYHVHSCSPLGHLSSVSSSVASVTSVANYSYLPNSDFLSARTS